ncbi:glycosyl transferase family protein [Parasphingorhabdus halotolerans]|uniref:Glycosyl transferase family protein n=1 Tax=Parasphingorhabdus halotolerans TaxID=2725558 RepID=A0A6H2DMA8_9SPHN|nr:glycosyl transferase family protein [Parasphingorhabdus halotolerans]QJB69267.1 glycosyl transferase family protein [Parasphingorhabdus halotolerans]
MMIEFALLFLDGLHKELLFFASICFLLGSIDDTIFDALWIGHKLKRKLFVYPKHQRATVESLTFSSKSEALAVFVPAWQEADVIGAMLQRCLRQWTYTYYRIYVGCYPNDPATIAAVAAAVGGSDKVRLVVCEEHGPTSKADCLNRLWKALCKDEIVESKTYGAIILHDAEDIVHPEALKLFGHLTGRASLVQIPVIPRRALKSRWIAGHYGDEFAELHAKQMVLREALGVSLPSAGVGCAFARSALARVSIRTRGKPFDAASMTEDYELGLKLTGAGGRGIFARLKDRQGQLVATQEFFPDNLDDAVRQKARWMAGIALMGWDRLGWKSCWRENWMRLRDRKASFAAIILALAYAAIVLTGLLWICSAAGFYQMQPISTSLKIMLSANVIFLAWRLAIKSYFVFSLYGFREALLSVPRTLVANIINIMAARLALAQYIGSLSGTPIRWDKTSHFYPELSEIQQLKTATQSSRE